MTRTALVTGGKRGIGLEASRQLARAGMNVVLAARDSQLGEEAAKKLRGEGLDVMVERLDVADSQSVKDCARRLAEAGTEINVLVNNAGVYPTEGVFSVSEETFEMALEVNTLARLGSVRYSCPRWCSAVTVGSSTSHPAVVRSAKV